MGHVIGKVVAVISQGRRGWDAGVLGELLASYEDITAALRWCLDNDDDPGRALTLLSVLWGVVQQGHAEDVSAVGEAVLHRWPEPSGPLWSDGMATIATCRYLLGRPAEAIELAERALSAAGDSLFAPCTLRRVIGQAYWALGDATSSMQAFDVAATEARKRGIAPLAMEIDVFRAHILAETGEIDGALAALHATRDEATRSGSDINEAWAVTTEGYVLMRADPDAAAGVIEAALEASRRFKYPACIAANLQALAILSVVEGRLAEAAGQVLDLLGYITHRGAVSELRTVFHVAAVVLHRVSNPAWADIAATAASLPVVSMFASPGHELLPLPPSSAAPLPRREAVLVARGELVAVRDGTVVPAEPATATVAGGGDNVFACVGDFWDVVFADRGVTIKSSKGMIDLGRLLASPGRDIHCLELVGATTDEPSTGAVIDRRRDGSTRNGSGNCRPRSTRPRPATITPVPIVPRSSSTRSSNTSRPHSAWADVSAAPPGARSNGRVRRSPSGCAPRSSASHEVHPELGRHLDASVSTGVYCRYRPEHPTGWRT